MSENTTYDLTLLNGSFQWQLDQGTYSFFGVPSTMFWIKPSLYTLLQPLAEEVGYDLFRLLVAQSSSFGTEEDYHAMINVFSDNFEDGFRAWGSAVSVCGWGLFEILDIDFDSATARVSVRNNMELILQEDLEERWGCPFIQGKLIGIFSNAFGVNCWAEEERISYDRDDRHVIFRIHPSDKSIDAELERLRKSRRHSKEQELEQSIRRKTAQLQQAKHNLEELYTQLADSETNYRNVFEHSLQGIFQLSPPPDSRFLAANDALARILGYPDTSRLMAAHQAVEVQLFADSRQRDTLFLQLAQSGAVHNVEVSLRRTDSSEIWVMLSMFALSAGDGATYYQGFLVDITDKRQKEQAEREKAMAEAASRMKSEFLANMSHEIRTPMNAVLGMTQLALRTELDGKQRNYLDKAHRSAQSLLGILNDILDFSKIEAGKLELEHVRFSLREVLDNVLSMQRFTADEKGLSLTLECAPGTPDVLVGDPLRLGQVLLNLTSNALKFTPAGGRVSVLVAGGRDAQAAVQLRLSVADTGIGIGPEQRELLFRSFSQGDVSTTRQFGGTGLGLAISRMLVGLMGGEIWVESEPGRGSTFSFTAHLVCPDAAGEPLEHGVEAATERLGVEVTALRGSRVLLVEDNEINLELAEEVLLQNGLLVTRATNGLEALEALDEGGFDGVLMDCQMPLMDGCEATRRIRRQERFRDLPIIAMTASAMRSDVEKALAAGMNAHLAKPIDIDALLRVLAAHLRPGMPSVRNEGDPDRPERPPPAVDLAALPGVDAQIGLASVAGNEALYRRLLQKFVEMDRYPAGQLRGYLDDGDYSALRQAAHALKGVSANLGMTRLQRYSADLEKACAQQGSDTATVLERMLAELDRVFAGIRRLQ